MQPIERIATMDIGRLAEAVAENAARFADMTLRQDAPGSPHPDTETIFLRFVPAVTYDAVFESMEIADYPAYGGAFRDAVEDIGHIAGMEPARALVIKLKPGGAIQRHYDGGTYAYRTDRFHLPIITNPDAWLSCGGQTEHLEAGGLYRFDKHLWHEGANDGATDRIHLVVDCWR